MNENIEKVLAILDGFRMSDEMTYPAYSALHDEISLLDDLLKETEQRVLTLEEAFDLQNRTPYPCIFVEIRERYDVFLATITDELYGDYHSEDFKVHRPWIGASRVYHKTEYGQSIRFWNLFPTDEYRKAVKWDG